MTMPRCLFFALLGLLAGAQPALANQPPGPFVLLSAVSILPWMMLLTLAGGGYAVLRRIGRRRRFRWLVAVVVLFFSFSHEGLAALVALVFGVVAVWRGLRMIGWGVEAKRQPERTEHLVDASPWRLLAAGTVLIVLTVVLAAQAMAFVGYWPVPQNQVEEAVTHFVAYQIAYQRARGRFHEVTGEEELAELSRVWSLRYGNARVEYAPDGKAFELLLPPSVTLDSGFPFFPFNYLVSHPSYRADESGKIRMVYTHHEELCRPDAPVVRIVTEAEIQAAEARLPEETLDSGP